MIYGWYAFDVIAYRRDTQHLTTLEHGAYRALIDEYMLTGMGLVDDDRALARIAGLSPDHWSAIATLLRGFFKRGSDGRLHQTHCDREINKQKKLALLRTKNGQKGADKRWGKNNEINGKAMATPKPSHGHTNGGLMAKHSTRQDKTRQDRREDASKKELEELSPSEEVGAHVLTNGGRHA